MKNITPTWGKRLSCLISPLLVAILCVTLIGILLSCHSDRYESFYVSLSDADKDGAITRGWIPDFVPQSSHNIHELHNLSPSTEWCAFEFLPSDSEGLRKNLKSANAPTPSVRHVPSPRVSWWPAMLKGDLDVQKIHKAGFDLYELESGKLFAIDWVKGRAFFYDTR